MPATDAYAAYRLVGLYYYSSVRDTAPAPFDEAAWGKGKGEAANASPTVRTDLKLPAQALSESGGQPGL